MINLIVWIAALLLFSSSHPQLSARAQSQCGGLAEDELIQRRIDSIRLNLIAQLGISDVPETTPENVTVAPPTNATLDEYSTLVNASKSIEESREKKCVSEDFYAKPVSFFTGSILLEESVSLLVTKRHAKETETVSESTTRISEHDGSTASEQSSRLASYRIKLQNFHLSSELREVTQADLLLYQLATVTGPDIDIRDKEQFVEVRTVLESLGERHVVEGKYLNVFDSGYKVFDITPAVRLWLFKGIQGNITLEVVVYCYSTPDCASVRNGTRPAVIQFNHKSGVDSDSEPKVMILSRNPIEVAEKAKRRKRQADGDAAQAVKFCKTNETMCCLKPLVLNFKRDLGLNFITQPESFEANFCEGYCPEVSGEDVMTSTRFQFLRDLQNSPAASIDPCCSGSEYRDLDVIMRKYKHNLGKYVTVIEHLQHVTVTKCKCA